MTEKTRCALLNRKTDVCRICHSKYGRNLVNFKPDVMLNTSSMDARTVFHKKDTSLYFHITNVHVLKIKKFGLDTVINPSHVHTMFG